MEVRKMIGRILGYNISSNTGTISSDNGTRYKFSKEDWKDNTPPQKEMKVDFEIGDENSAKDIYLVIDKEAENSTTLLGLVAVGITFFFGFIGTFVSRLFIAKEPIGSVIIPTIIHLVISILIIVPLLGWVIYMIGTGYYMYKNFILVTQQNNNKYA
jgi:hypothetical protein